MYLSIQKLGGLQESYLLSRQLTVQTLTKILHPKSSHSNKLRLPVYLIARAVLLRKKAHRTTSLFSLQIGRRCLQLSLLLLFPSSTHTMDFNAVFSRKHLGKMFNHFSNSMLVFSQTVQLAQVILACQRARSTERQSPHHTCVQL